MKSKIYLKAIIFGLTTIALISCGSKISEKDLLEDVSAVWQDKVNTNVTIDLTSEEKYISLGQHKLKATIKEIDIVNNNVVVKLSYVKTGIEKIATINQEWDDKNETFTVSIIVDGQAPIPLSFLRNL